MVLLVRDATRPWGQPNARPIRTVSTGEAVAIPLPHPSGASSWLNVPANRERVAAAAELVRAELARMERGVPSSG